MSLKERLLGGGKVEALHERSLELEHALGERPTVDDLEPLRLVLEELCEAGYWPAHKSLAILYGKKIWITLDWGERELDDASQHEKSEIGSYAALGLLQLQLYCERGGRKIDTDMAADVESYRQEFYRYDPRRMTPGAAA
ncbi:MAG: hypothetical protein ACXVRS_05370 [Gaiellaceae bacterium]